MWGLEAEQFRHIHALDGGVAEVERFVRQQRGPVAFHTGGDELNNNASMLDPGVKSNDTNVLQPLLQKFIDVNHDRVRKAGLAPIVWEEIPLDWGVNLGREVVVQTWRGQASVKNMTSQGHQVIDSNSDYWVSLAGLGCGGDG